MLQSIETPQATVNYTVPVNELVSFLEKVNATRQGPDRITMLPVFAQLVAKSLQGQSLNYRHSATHDAKVSMDGKSDIGIAVATESGNLVVVCLKSVLTRSLDELQRDFASLVARARSGKATKEDLDLSQAISVISNMGSKGDLAVTSATPLLVPGISNLLVLGNISQETTQRRPQKPERTEHRLPVSFCLDHSYDGGANASTVMRSLVQEIKALEARTVV